VYQFRSRKSWAVLAYLVLSDVPPTRSQLASLLFGDADDPLRALRWSRAEIRRGLGDGGSLAGDPPALVLPPGTVVDADVVAHGSWVNAMPLPGLGSELLEGLTIRDAPVFETWLLSKRRNLAATSEAMLHEAALGLLSRGDLAGARDLAVRAAALGPLDETHHALLIRLYRLGGDSEAAERQFATCADLLERELGIAPGPGVHAAMRTAPPESRNPVDPASIHALVEAGSAAISAGATAAGVDSLRTAARLADDADVTDVRVSARLVLAEGLIHSLGGLDEEGQATLHEADRIALAHDDRAAVAEARAELGYVDYLRGRYDRAEHWLRDALAHANGSVSVTAKATTYLGSVESDRANYPQALDLLERGVDLSRAAGEPRREAYSLSMLGRISLLRGDLGLAGEQLRASAELAERDHWLSFLPWPQAMIGSVALACGDPDGANRVLQQAFARACQLGDPCWEGMAALGLARVADATGQTGRAFEVLADARWRCNRLTDPYVWLDVHILDAQCELGVREQHPDTRAWVDTMRDLASRTGMRELTVRALLHGARLGNPGDAAAASLLAADIDNPVLARQLLS
jgi:DNA-binding SARP family transcriptional activator